MQTLKLIWLACLRGVQQVGTLPQIIAHAAEERRRQGARNELEAERLDRIRNPSKYRGK